MHEVLVWIMTKTVLQYPTFSSQIAASNFSKFRKISRNATIEFGNTCFFKDEFVRN